MICVTWKVWFIAQRWSLFVIQMLFVKFKTGTFTKQQQKLLPLLTLPFRIRNSITPSSQMNFILKISWDARFCVKFGFLFPLMAERQKQDRHHCVLFSPVESVLHEVSS